MTRFPQIPALHRCKNRGFTRVYALRGDLHKPRGGRPVLRRTKTDGMSVPFFVRWTAGLFFRFIRFKFKRGLASHTIHDDGYARQEKPQWFYDIEYYRNLRLEGYTQWQARQIYKALRKFGHIAWNKNTKRPRSYFECTEAELQS